LSLHRDFAETFYLTVKTVRI